MNEQSNYQAEVSLILRAVNADDPEAANRLIEYLKSQKLMWIERNDKSNWKVKSVDTVAPAETDDKKQGGHTRADFQTHTVARVLELQSIFT